MGRSRSVSGLTISLTTFLTLAALVAGVAAGYGVLSAYVYTNRQELKEMKVAMGAVTQIRIDQVISDGRLEIMRKDIDTIARYLEVNIINETPPGIIGSTDSPEHQDLMSKKGG